ncbi:MAG: nucleoside 2-deoxyribosyltransferase domain-containing protein [Acidobacteriota bacterium]
MNYIECPTEWNGSSTSLFLGGGITDCPDWQQEVVRQLANKEAITKEALTILNPRRNNFPIHDPAAANAQIEWEFWHLRVATAILFWFPCETLCPIVLYELGAWSMTQKPLFVGVHPEYQRLQDVIIQTRLARPDVKVVYSLEELAKQVLIWVDQL